MFQKNLIEFLLVFCLFAGNVCGVTPTSNQPHTVFCVTVTQESNSTDDNLCGNYHSIESHTLAFYMNNHKKYFKSNQTYVFQHGEHIPRDDFLLKIKNVTNLTLTGVDNQPDNGIVSTKEAVINCNGSATAFEFSSFSNVILKDLTIISCVTKPSKRMIGRSILLFLEGFYLSLQRLRVLLSVDQAFFIKNVYGEVNIDSVDIMNSNTDGKAVQNAGNTIKYHRCPTGSKVNISHSRFINNSNFVHSLGPLYAAGLTIDLQCPNIEVKLVNVTMINNTGAVGGNFALLFISTHTFFNSSVEIVNSQFECGFAAEGGGMYVSFMDRASVKAMPCVQDIKPHSLVYVYNSTFNNNTAMYAGGGVYLRQKQSLTLHNAHAITLENVSFTKNLIVKAGFGGIAVHSLNFMVTDYIHHLYPQFHIVLVNCIIHSNHVKYYLGDGSGTGAVFTKSNNNFQMNNTAVFNNNATGILGMSSNIILSGNVTIIHNVGSSGGGLLLCQNAVIYLDTRTNVTIAHNKADHTGGGICVQTDYLQSRPICFFQLTWDPLINPYDAKTLNVSVYNNSAILAGNNIFGGSIEYCYMIDSPKHKANRSTDIYDSVFHVPKNEDIPSSVTSSPRHLCFCQNNKPNCTLKSYNSHSIFPGETIYVDAVLVGQYNGTVPGTVQATLNSLNFSFEPNQDVQDIKTVNCTQLQYTINSSHRRETLTFKVQHTGDISGFDQFWKLEKYSVSITMKTCPMGFSLAVATRRNGTNCNCSPFLRNISSNYNCTIKTQMIERIPPAWIGYVHIRNGSKILAYHNNCPFDYCKDKVSFLFATNDSLDQDEQCAYSRTGTLCGSCSPGLSSLMGSSECLACSNYWLLFYIVYALIGILALIMLTLLNLTIAEGTLSGVIFYCNIVGSNMTIFFPGQSIPVLTPVITFFVSLINMETGIAHCHFNGMDAYAIAWLNFGFPIYIWFISGLLICLGNRFSWIIRRNAVKVLATLILLSYARLINTVMDALQVRFIILEMGGYDKRWLIDGNIKYFTGKHIFLVIFASLFCLLLLPFTFCLVFIQCLLSASHYRGFSWINKLKPFFDAYTGPFTSKARSWTGLLLVSRGIVCIVSAVDTNGDPKKILGTISLTVTSLLVFISLLPAGLYRRRCLNTLECVFLLNLGVLTSLIYIFSKDKILSVIIPHVCVSIALLTLFGIIIYHITSLAPIKNRIRASALYRKVVQLCAKRNATLRDFTEIDTDYFPPYEPFNEEREPLLSSINGD